jgi:hypothetical protein
VIRVERDLVFVEVRNLNRRGLAGGKTDLQKVADGDLGSEGKQNRLQRIPKRPTETRPGEGSSE